MIYGGDKKRCTLKSGPYITVGHTIEILGTGASDLSLGSTLDANRGSTRSAATEKD
ncbi:protein of unknown function [Hyphomicrobium sp. MC1]|nr:protein of unknown function [Hyphomicrobium sp. MC1]